MWSISTMRVFFGTMKADLPSMLSPDLALVRKRSIVFLLFNPDISQKNRIEGFSLQLIRTFCRNYGDLKYFFSSWNHLCFCLRRSFFSVPLPGKASGPACAPTPKHWSPPSGSGTDRAWTCLSGGLLSELHNTQPADFNKTLGNKNKKTKIQGLNNGLLYTGGHLSRNRLFRLTWKFPGNHERRSWNPARSNDFLLSQ